MWVCTYARDKSSDRQLEGFHLIHQLALQYHLAVTVVPAMRSVKPGATAAVSPSSLPPGAGGPSQGRTDQTRTVRTTTVSCSGESCVSLQRPCHAMTPEKCTMGDTSNKSCNSRGDPKAGEIDDVNKRPSSGAVPVSVARNDANGVGVHLKDDKTRPPHMLHLTSSAKTSPNEAHSGGPGGGLACSRRRATSINSSNGGHDAALARPEKRAVTGAITMAAVTDCPEGGGKGSCRKRLRGESGTLASGATTSTGGLFSRALRQIDGGGRGV